MTTLAEQVALNAIQASANRTGKKVVVVLDEHRVAIARPGGDGAVVRDRDAWVAELADEVLAKLDAGRFHEWHGNNCGGADPGAQRSKEHEMDERMLDALWGAGIGGEARAMARKLADEVAKKVEGLARYRAQLDAEIEKLEALQLALMAAEEAAEAVLGAGKAPAAVVPVPVVAPEPPAAVTVPAAPAPVEPEPEDRPWATPDERLAWAQRGSQEAEAANDPDEVRRAHRALNDAEAAMGLAPTEFVEPIRVQLAPVLALGRMVQLEGGEEVAAGVLTLGTRFWWTAAEGIDERLVEVSERPKLLAGDEVRVPIKVVKGSDGEPVTRDSSGAAARAAGPIGHHAVALVVRRPGRWFRAREVAEAVAAERRKAPKKVRDAVRKGLEKGVADGVLVRKRFGKITGRRVPVVYQAKAAQRD